MALAPIPHQILLPTAAAFLPTEHAVLKEVLLALDLHSETAVLSTDGADHLLITVARTAILRLAHAAVVRLLRLLRLLQSRRMGLVVIREVLRVLGLPSVRAVRSMGGAVHLLIIAARTATVRSVAVREGM